MGFKSMLVVGYRARSFEIRNVASKSVPFAAEILRSHPFATANGTDV